MTRKLRVVVGGYLGLLPAGGVTWDYLQYPLGFAGMGHDVYYIEDTRLWPVFQQEGADPADCSATVAHLASVMNAFGLKDRWAYRDEPSGQCFGMSVGEVEEICRSADLLVNVSCSTYMRDEYLGIPVRVLIDSDPMFTQIQYQKQTSFYPGESGLRDMIDAHTHHFTFGENVNDPNCAMPDCGISWRPTRQPICLDYWGLMPLPSDGGFGYSTVMNWTAAPPLEYAGQSWGQKDVEFRKLMLLPRRVSGIPLSVAVGQTTGAAFPALEARNLGWSILDPHEVAPDWASYQQFIYGSAGEFSVAKETYAKARTGWFSCRSACYLAAGRPVVTQDTGWSKFLPHDCGLLGFNSLDQAVEALEEVVADPRKHAVAARSIAKEYFESPLVLGGLLNEIGV